MITVMAVLRREHKVSQVDISIALGVSQPAVSFIENGTVNPRDAHKQIIADLIGLEDIHALQMPYAEYVRQQSKGDS